jgi:hypothetical protein
VLSDYTLTKTCQAVCKDRLFPYIHVFGKGYGKDGDPRVATIITFVIALGIVMIGMYIVVVMCVFIITNKSQVI